VGTVLVALALYFGVGDRVVVTPTVTLEGPRTWQRLEKQMQLEAPGVTITIKW
jgi:hypothetical protein